MGQAEVQFGLAASTTLGRHIVSSVFIRLYRSLLSITAGFSFVGIHFNRSLRALSNIFNKCLSHYLVSCILFISIFPNYPSFICVIEVFCFSSNVKELYFLFGEAFAKGDFLEDGLSCVVDGEESEWLRHERTLRSSSLSIQAIATPNATSSSERRARLST
jgi:hypothetical protein